jgi:hypothetical protein
VCIGIGLLGGVSPLDSVTCSRPWKSVPAKRKHQGDREGNLRVCRPSGNAEGKKRDSWPTIR